MSWKRDCDPASIAFHSRCVWQTAARPMRVPSGGGCIRQPTWSSGSGVAVATVAGAGVAPGVVTLSVSSACAAPAIENRPNAAQTRLAPTIFDLMITPSMIRHGHPRAISTLKERTVTVPGRNAPRLVGAVVVRIAVVVFHLDIVKPRLGAVLQYVPFALRLADRHSANARTERRRLHPADDLVERVRRSGACGSGHRRRRHHRNGRIGLCHSTQRNQADCGAKQTGRSIGCYHAIRPVLRH